MKIDIHIPFNDIIVKGRSDGFVAKEIEYYDQLIFLLKSLKLNWNKNILNYNVYVHFSRELNKGKQQKIESLGGKLIYDKKEYGRFFNKINAYKHKTDGDFSLILDTDTIILDTPEFDFNKEIYMRSNNNVFDEHNWLKWYKILKIDHSTPYHFNNGCVLIKNSCKEKLFKMYLSGDVNLLMNDLMKNHKTKHFSGQITQSILIKRFNWGFLPKDINVYPMGKTNFDGIKLLHYLGSNGFTKEVDELLKKIK